MEAYEEVDEINMEAWPENNSYITDTDIIAGVENEANDEDGENEKITHNTMFNDGEKLA